MSPENAEEYTQSLGQIIGGSWRQILLAHKIGVPKALKLSTEEWVQQRLGGYVKLSVSDRKEAVVELLNDGLSQREAAEVLGVSQSTIKRESNDSADAEGSVQSESNDSISPKQFRTIVEAKFENWLQKNWDFPEDNKAATIVRRYCGKRTPTRQMKMPQ